MIPVRSSIAPHSAVLSRSLAPVYACVVIAHFAAQVLVRLRPELAAAAVAVMDGERPKEFCMSSNRAARSLGVQHGMTRVEVETYDGITVVRRSKTEEAAALAVLVEAAGLFTPRVEVRGARAEASKEDWECWLDLSGTERLLGEPKAAGELLLGQLRRLGFQAHVVVSANYDAGLCLARYAAHRVIPVRGPQLNGRLSAKAQMTKPGPMAGASPKVRVIRAGEEARALGPLPLAVMELTGEQQERFSAWGIRTLGALAKLPELDLIARMGQDGRRLWQRARGESTHLLRPVEARFVLEEEREFEEPVDLMEPLLYALSAMLDQLLVRAESKAVALAEVRVALLIEGTGDRLLGAGGAVEEAPVVEGGWELPPGGSVHMRSVRPAVATLDRALLLKLLQLDLEAHPPAGSVVRMRVTADPGDASRVQLGLFSPPMPEPTRLEVTMARIAGIVGEGRAGKVRLKDSHVEEEFAIERFALPSAVKIVPVSVTAMTKTVLRRIRPAAAVKVVLLDGRIHLFVHDGMRYKVERIYGPWRSSGQWWSDEVWSVDIWDVAAEAQDGTVLLGVIMHDLLRDTWVLDGVYD